MERERIKDADALQNTTYEQVIKYYKQWTDREKNGKVLVKGDELEYQTSRQGFLKYYLIPFKEDTAVSSWAVFEHLIKNQSGRHRHQGGIIIYVLEGHGRTETDDVILEWKAGDLLLLPIKPEGSSHQHWNMDASKGCRWVAFRDMLVARTIAGTDWVLVARGLGAEIDEGKGVLFGPRSSEVRQRAQHYAWRDLMSA